MPGLVARQEDENEMKRIQNIYDIFAKVSVYFNERTSGLSPSSWLSCQVLAGKRPRRSIQKLLVTKELVNRAVVDQLALAHGINLLAIFGQPVHVVGDHDHGLALG